MEDNNHIALITGPPASGKSASLVNLRDPEGVVYFNTDMKPLPFNSKFQEIKITDPSDILGALEEVESMPEVHTVIVDTLTFLMDMYESQYVVNSANTMKAWGDYAQFYKTFIHLIKSSTKSVIVLAHEKKIMNESEMVMETKVPVKGAVGNTGVEADFTTILSTKKILIKKLKAKNKLLTISEREEMVGIKYLFQTYVDKDTVNEKMRSAMALWSDDEKFINNDIQSVIDRLSEYYV